MNYTESVEYINNKQWTKGERRDSMDNMELLLSKMGNPQDSFKSIHVAGTNGKGSTCAYIESILRSNNINTGLFTSPYIEVINERIRINNENISDELFTKAVGIVKKHIEELESVGYFYSFFDILTAMCFYVFKEQHVEIAVIEVGIGGRYDSTNVINPILSIITPIGYDHMGILGNSIDEIASNKAGIIKRNTPVVVSPQKYDEAYAVILNESQNNNAPLYNLDNAGIIIDSTGINGSVFTFSYGELKADITTPLLGMHQVINASVAFFTMVILAQTASIPLTSKGILEGITNTKWQGRCEVIDNNPLTIIDGAHNEQSFNALIDTIKSIYPIGKVNIIFAIQSSKNREKILKTIGKITNCVYLVDDFGNNFVECDILKEDLDDNNIQNIVIGNLSDTLYYVKSNSNLPIVICGSLYLTAPAKRILAHN